MSLNVQFKRLDPRAEPPERQRSGDAGCDLRALESVEIAPGGRALVRTGLAVAIPPGWEGQVRPRSGLALEQGLTVLNSPGTIDSGYRGEVGVILFNTDAKSQIVKAGSRIAQLVIAPVAPDMALNEVDSLPETERGDGGFGHTGT
jgi:dUTP pyrophosphatase